MNYFQHNNELNIPFIFKEYVSSPEYKKENPLWNPEKLNFRTFYNSGLPNNGQEIFNVKNDMKLFFIMGSQFHSTDENDQMSISFNCSCGGVLTELANYDIIRLNTAYYKNTTEVKNLIVFNMFNSLNIDWFNAFGYIVESKN